MAEYTIPAPGTICWRELATTDPAAATAFYKEMFGWTVADTMTGGKKYGEIHYDGKAIGGLLQIDETWGENPPSPYWTAYVAVANADETVTKIKENGGSMFCEPFDIPGVGRIAVAADPAGASFAIIQFEQPA